MRDRGAHVHQATCATLSVQFASSLISALPDRHAAMLQRHARYYYPTQRPSDTLHWLHCRCWQVPAVPSPQEQLQVRQGPAYWKGAKALSRASQGVLQEQCKHTSPPSACDSRALLETQEPDIVRL